MTEHQKELNKIRQAKYRKTEKRRLCLARYRKTEKGKATQKRHDIKQRSNPKRKEYLRMHEQLPKTKARRRLYKEKPENKEKVYLNSLMRFYKMTPDEFQSLKDKQNGQCAICGISPKDRLVVDHCHKTGRVRGLLCRKCNLGIGYLKDSIEFLSKAIEYLK